ncbi:MAG TPA: hypothetical protein PLD47_18120 [Aggregatilineales bacterium]|nr:hypothetical protein [Anaerolineales bacterium]HRE49646.1 hypothetical protein [Aggregatilineales bacterium]
MPAATEYAPERYREAGEAERSARRHAHAAAWAAYEGRFRRSFPPRPGEADDNTAINLLKQAVDRLCAFVAPDFPALDLDPLRESADELWLRRAWKAAGGARLMTKFARFGALDGHIVARVIPPAMGSPFPRLIALNPSLVTTYWRADDAEHVLWYEINYSAGGVDYRQDVVRQGEAGRWLIRDFRREAARIPALTPGAWTLANETAWAYPLPPLVDWAHDPYPDRYYGVGEAGNLALNERVNSVASDISRILRFHAAPRTIGIGFTAGEVTGTGIDHFWTIPARDAQVFNLEMKTDLASSMNFLNFCTRSFMAERRVIQHEGSLSEMRYVTNLGIRALYLDQLARAEELRRNYEPGIAALSRTMLMLSGRYDGRTPLDVILHWRDPLPVGDLEMLEALERERAMGIISRETAARERGRDWRMETTRMSGESGVPVGQFGTMETMSRDVGG